MRWQGTRLLFGMIDSKGSSGGAAEGCESLGPADRQLDSEELMVHPKTRS